MELNPILTKYGESYPERVFARVSQVEQSLEGRPLDQLQFAAVDSRWLSEREPDLVPLISFARAPLSVITIERRVVKSAGVDSLLFHGKAADSSFPLGLGSLVVRG
jgi:hypothetical protein